MPSRNSLAKFVSLCCFVTALSCAVHAQAQTKVYNINRPPSAEPATMAPAQPVRAFRPMTAQPVQPPRPLAASSQPPLAVSQPASLSATIPGQPGMMADQAMLQMPPTQVITAAPPPMEPMGAASPPPVTPAAVVLPVAAATPAVVVIPDAAVSPSAAATPVAAAPAEDTMMMPTAPGEPPQQVQLRPAGDNPLAPPPPVYRPPQRPQSQVTLTGMPPPRMSLATRSGIDLGIQVSDYRYRQPDQQPSVTISGARYGGTLTGTAALGQGLFAALDGRYSTGWLDYKGTGDLGNRRDYYWETRALFGKDFVFEYFSLSPYSGFGYRYLNDDLRGTSSTGTQLYLRENQLFYVPIGIHPRATIDEGSRFSSTFEYDFLVNGQEKSHLNDAGANDPMVRNKQPDGFGFRVALMYETRFWSIGPFGNYWSVSTSKPSTYTSPASTCGSATCTFTEPYNHTIEAGVQFKVHLF